MGIGKRISRIIKSNVNDLLSAAENPDKQLDLLISEMEDSLRQAKQQLVEQMALEKRLQRQLDEADELVNLWSDKAQKAVDLGEDELARQALRKKKTYEELASDYDRQLFEQQNAVDQLREQYRMLEVRLKESRERRAKIGHELRRREASTSTSTTSTTALRSTSAFDKFEEMADKVDAFEAETQARAELEEMLEPDDTLSAKIEAAKDRRSGSVDAELEELRSRAGERLSRRRAPETEAAPAKEEPQVEPGERLSRRRSRSERQLESDAPTERPRPKPETEEGDDGGDGGDGWGRRVEL